MATMPGWLSRPAADASRRKRSVAPATTSGSSSRLPMVFTATRRSMTGSYARYTTPMVPAPSVSRISYFPRRLGASARIGGGLRLTLLLEHLDRVRHALLHAIERLSEP